MLSKVGALEKNEKGERVGNIGVEPIEDCKPTAAHYALNKMDLYIEITFQSFEGDLTLNCHPSFYGIYTLIL